MLGAVEDFSIELPGDVHAAGLARRAVMARVRDLQEPLQGDVLLLVTELVTNAVRHGPVEPEGSVRLECRRAGDGLRFLVSDPGTQLLRNGGLPALELPGTNGDVQSGWGLMLVERIADQWGILAAPTGTCVWFEVAA
jgi:anti-sigma regulatory factor (Ser/Thr protein kinase)